MDMFELFQMLFAFWLQLCKMVICMTLEELTSRDSFVHCFCLLCTEHISKVQNSVDVQISFDESQCNTPDNDKEHNHIHIVPYHT